MKKELSKPAVFGIIAVAIAVVGGIFYFGMSGPKELPGGQKLPGYKEGIPDYVKQAQQGQRSAGPGQNPGQPSGMGDTTHMTPEQQAKIQESMRNAGK